MGELSARAVLVTGAASGIGRALAEALARRGTPVALCDLDAAGADAAAEGIEYLEQRDLEVHALQDYEAPPLP